MAKQTKKSWSYSTGEKGRNRVRAFEKADGKLYLEWRDEAGRKVRRRLGGVRDKTEAKREADEHAAELGRIEELRTAPMTLDRLLDLYTKEVTPTKGRSKQGHDRRAVRVWKAFFGSQPEAHRRCSRGPSSLDRTDWDRFIGARRAGAIPGWERGVRDRQVGYDLAFMIAVLNWACGRRERGLPVLEASPWRAEVRRAQRWTLPREKSPHRPGMTVELREGLIRHQPNWQFGLALLLERETRRRNSSIRRLLWADVDLAEETVAWRAELDKAGRTTVTALTPAAVEALRTAPSRGIGSAPVFPSATDPSRPTPRNTFQTWLRRAKSTWIESVPETERQQLRRRLRGVGFHAEKRAGVRDPWFRSLEPQVQEILAGTNWTTLKNVYDEVTLEDQRRVIDAQPKVAGGD